MLLISIDIADIFRFVQFNVSKTADSVPFISKLKKSTIGLFKAAITACNGKH